MQYHHFDSKTKLYTHSSPVVMSPKNNKKPLPTAFALFVDLPDLEKNQAARCNKDRTGWDVIPNYLGTKYWLSYDEEREVTEIDELVPEGAFLDRPDEPIGRVKSRKISMLSNAISSEIQSGFKSDALGSMHMYPSTETDQINLAGLVAISIDAAYVCEDEQGVWDKRLHTTAQLKKVAIDGAMWKSALLDEFRARRDVVEKAITVEEIDSVSETY